MKRALLILTLCAGVAIPAAALAQERPAPPTPSPEMRALMDRVRTETKTAAFAALTPAHAAAVNAIASKVAAKTLDLRAGEKQVDETITVAEEKAVDAAVERSHRAMFAAMMAAGGGPGPMMGGRPPRGPGSAPADGARPPAGVRPSGGSPRMEANRGWYGPHHHGPSASRTLLMLSMTRDQMRQLMPRARSSAAP